MSRGLPGRHQPIREDADGRDGVLVNRRYDRLVRFLRLIAEILWWGLLIVVPVYALLAVLAAAAPGFPIAYVPLTMDVWIGPGTSDWVLEGSDGRIAELSGGSARFGLRQAPTGERVGFVTLWLLYQLALLPVLWNLRKLLRRFSMGSPFQPENVSHLRRLGVWILATAGIRLALEVGVAASAVTAFGGGDPELRVAPYFSGALPLLGLAILALAEIFRRGWDLEDEQTWTV